MVKTSVYLKNYCFVYALCSGFIFEPVWFYVFFIHNHDEYKAREIKKLKIIKNKQTGLNFF